MAAFLRLYRLGDFVTFLGDQGRDATIIKRILNLEHLPAIGPPSSIGQIYLGPFYYYLISPFLLIFNYNPLGLAFGVSILSIFALIIIYFVTKKEINTQIAIFFLILLAFSTTNIDLSRYSWNPNLLPIFAFFTLYFFYKLIKNNKIFDAVLFGAFLSFSIQLHYLAVFLIFPIIFISIQKPNHGSWKKFLYDKIKLLIAFIVFIIFSFPLIFFDLRHQFINSKNFLKLFTNGGVVSNSSYLSRLPETISSFFQHVFKTSLPHLVILLFFSYLIIYLLLNSRRINLFIRLHLLNVLFFLFAFSLLNSQRHPHYYGTIYYSFFLIIACLFANLKSYVKYILILVFFISYIRLNAKYYYFLTNKPNNQIQQAQIIAKSIFNNIVSHPYQSVPLPSGQTDGHIRYFLEIYGKKPLEENSLENPKELYILCFAPKCYPILGNPQWQIASFLNARIDKMWETQGVKIYKLIH